MGTNYYWYPQAMPDKCPTCGHERQCLDGLHIGKSSAGWCFSLHVIPAQGISSLADWRERWKSGEIRDEYDHAVDVETMDAIITERRGGAMWGKRFTSPSNELDFHRNNYSMRGPHGLLRHKIGTHCVEHGDGTWDLITGEFS